MLSLPVSAQQLEVAGPWARSTVSGQKSSAAYMELKSGANVVFPTSEVNLRHSQLDGNYYYIGGGMSKTDDGIAGIWVKLFKGETLVGEYMNPPNLTTKFKWE